MRITHQNSALEIIQIYQNFITKKNVVGIDLKKA